MKTKGLADYDVGILALIILASLGIHCTVLLDGFGEQDAAQLVNDANNGVI